MSCICISACIYTHVAQACDYIINSQLNPERRGLFIALFLFDKLCRTYPLIFPNSPFDWRLSRELAVIKSSAKPFSRYSPP
jgi:hypothetical protein